MYVLCRYYVYGSFRRGGGEVFILIYVGQFVFFLEKGEVESARRIVDPIAQ